MKNTIGDRLSTLLKTIRMTEPQLASKVNKTPTVIYRIVNGETLNPTRTTIEIIAKATGCNFDWLMYGDGEMLSQQQSNSNAESNPWRDALVTELKEEVQYLRDMLKMAMGKTNFRKALDRTAIPFNLLNQQGIGSSAYASR